jgi:hypothetical protein
MPQDGEPNNLLAEVRQEPTDVLLSWQTQMERDLVKARGGQPVDTGWTAAEIEEGLAEISEILSSRDIRKRRTKALPADDFADFHWSDILFAGILQGVAEREAKPKGGRPVGSKKGTTKEIHDWWVELGSPNRLTRFATRLRAPCRYYVFQWSARAALLGGNENAII